MASAYTDAMDQSYTVNQLKRWSCIKSSPPDVESINELHVYDFDNTMFMTPLPNRSLWDHQTWSRLQNPDVFVQGGWWHDAEILSATGRGIEYEEPRAWDGHWNENIVELIRLSMKQKDALTVLLTGRAEDPFADLIHRICESKKLKFDLYVLKPLISPTNQKPSSTMSFKQDFLASLIRTYSASESMKLYEDRIKHVKDFRSFFVRFNDEMRHNSIPRGTISAEVIEVTDIPGLLDPVSEAAAIQNMINAHNASVRAGTAERRAKATMLNKKVLYTAYQIRSPQDSASLIKLVNLPKSAKKLANSIVITTYPADADTLLKAGGLGKVVKFQVTAVGYVTNLVWAVEVNSIGGQAYTTLGRLQVVLAVNEGGKPSDVRSIKEWYSVPKEGAPQFEAVVSEVFRLSLEEERPRPPIVPTKRVPAVPQKRRADHFSPDHTQNNRQSNSYQPPAPRGRGTLRGRGEYRGRGDARGGRRGGAPQQNSRGGYAPRGGNNARGRGGRGNRDISNRRGGYKDHDAQGGAKPSNERNMHNDY